MSTRPEATRRFRTSLLVVVAGLTALAGACGSAGNRTASGGTSGGTTSAPSARSAAGSATKHTGVVDVLSAGSLQILMQDTVAPLFKAATGYTLDNFSAGSKDLAQDIKGKIKVADVFVSASPTVNTGLEGTANGNWVSWYAAFASSPLVLGYYPKSRFAHDLRTMPWYQVITEPGFLLGRTNPAEDPGGVLQAEALNETAQARHRPVLHTLATETKDEYQETALEGDVESGQLDAGFMYLADANSDKLPHVDLSGVHLAGDYTITVVNRAPHPAAAAAFVTFLLGPTGQAEMRKDQFAIVSPPKVTGTGVPASLKGVLGS